MGIYMTESRPARGSRVKDSADHGVDDRDIADAHSNS